MADKPNTDEDNNSKSTIFDPSKFSFIIPGEYIALNRVPDLYFNIETGKLTRNNTDSCTELCGIDDSTNYGLVSYPNYILDMTNVEYDNSINRVKRCIYNIGTKRIEYSGMLDSFYFDILSRKLFVYNRTKGFIETNQKTKFENAKSMVLLEKFFNNWVAVHRKNMAYIDRNEKLATTHMLKILRNKLIPVSTHLAQKSDIFTDIKCFDTLLLSFDEETNVYNCVNAPFAISGNFEINNRRPAPKKVIYDIKRNEIRDTLEQDEILYDPLLDTCISFTMNKFTRIPIQENIENKCLLLKMVQERYICQGKSKLVYANKIDNTNLFRHEILDINGNDTQILVSCTIHCILTDKYYNCINGKYYETIPSSSEHTLKCILLRNTGQGYVCQDLPFKWYGEPSLNMRYYLDSKYVALGDLIPLSYKEDRTTIPAKYPPKPIDPAFSLRNDEINIEWSDEEEEKEEKEDEQYEIGDVALQNRRENVKSGDKIRERMGETIKIALKAKEKLPHWDRKRREEYSGREAEIIQNRKQFSENINV